MSIKAVFYHKLRKKTQIKKLFKKLFECKKNIETYDFYKIEIQTVSKNVSKLNKVMLEINSEQFLI